MMMSLKDKFLALCVVVVWGLNFVVIKIGVEQMPPLLLAGLRFVLVAFPVIFFVKRPQVPLRWLIAYGMTISFGQFAFLFFAIKLGMPVGLASVMLQAQVFFTILLGVLLLSEKLYWYHIAGMAVTVLGMVILATAGMPGDAIQAELAHGQLALGQNTSGQVALDQNSAGITLTTLIVILAAALSWGLGNISNKMIMRDHQPAVMSLVVWSALVPIAPFFVCSWLFDGTAVMTASLVNIQLPTVLALCYLAYIATFVGYGIWGYLLSRYETWRVTPLSLLVPVVGIFSGALILGERLAPQQMLGALVIIIGLLVNVFGGTLQQRWLQRA
ncbi:EamA family transporter [Rheinheimera sp. 4Y26]|uniref:EamA family transporter n=1 Tax=Rheinheimera sp. 4Y26 TaxID=2977811 RepID=UPI0021B10433|nr:EamA family transporter [Rheinheimera sp. 4Y26]MCT6698633.1 EamA family transporter [Rheinheimera sp. 4Y26]